MERREQTNWYSPGGRKLCSTPGCTKPWVSVRLSAALTLIYACNACAAAYWTAQAAGSNGHVNSVVSPIRDEHEMDR